MTEQIPERDPPTRRDCYRRLRRQGRSRLGAAVWGLFLFSVVSQPGIELREEEPPDKWRVEEDT